MSAWALCFLIALVHGATRTVNASASGPIPGRTGGFGEMTCQQCHWDNALNDPSGQLLIEGVPPKYTPGERYVITLRLTRPETSRAGFQIAAREDGINMNSGNDAGVLHADDASVQTVQDKAKRVTYLQHASSNRLEPTGAVSWTFSWTAPQDGPVVFHLAANASNGDDSPLGDFIYTAIAKSNPEEP